MRLCRLLFLLLQNILLWLKEKLIDVLVNRQAYFQINILFKNITFKNELLHGTSGIQKKIYSILMFF